jgi:hypothetical protein
LAEKNGRLYRFEERRVTVIDLWPSPRAWRKTTKRSWHSCRPYLDIRLGLGTNPPSITEDEGDASLAEIASHAKWRQKRWKLYHRAVSRIPERVRAVVKRFPPTRQFHVLSLIARCPHASELCETNPAIGLALSSNWIFHKTRKPLRAARALIDKPRRIICGWLGFPATPAAARCLARIPRATLSIGRLLYLRTAMSDPLRMRQLCFLRPNSNVIRIISDSGLWPHVSQRFLLEAGNLKKDDRVPYAAYCLQDTLDLWRMTHANTRPLVSDDLGRLLETHARLTAEANATRVTQRRFPKHPLPSSRELSKTASFESGFEVTPLSDTRQLACHAASQHNCALSRTERVLAGREYLYAVKQAHKPIGTVSILKTFGGWRLGEAKGPGNRALPKKVWVAIRHWFALVSSSCDDRPPESQDGHAARA